MTWLSLEQQFYDLGSLRKSTFVIRIAFPMFHRKRILSFMWNVDGLIKKIK